MPPIAPIDKSWSTRLSDSLADPYNQVSILVSVLGFALTLIGLWIAYKQIRKTVTAAEAARIATEETRNTVVLLTNLVDLTTVAKYASDVLILGQGGEWVAAAMRSTDLRGCLARLRESEQGKDLMPKQKWTALISLAKSLEDVLSSYSQQAPIAPDVDTAQALATAGQIHETIHSLTAKGLRAAAEK